MFSSSSRWANLDRVPSATADVGSNDGDSDGYIGVKLEKSSSSVGCGGGVGPSLVFSKAGL